MRWYFRTNEENNASLRGFVEPQTCGLHEGKRVQTTTPRYVQELRSITEQNELCSLPGYWHSCRIVNRTWHLPQNKIGGCRSATSRRGESAQSITIRRGARFRKACGRQVGRCPLLNRRSRLESCSFVFFPDEKYRNAVICL